MSRYRTIHRCLLGGLLALAASAPLVAHHAFGAEFDKDAPIRLEGKIVKLEWVNPHSWIHMEIANDEGEPEVDGTKIFMGSSGTGAPGDAERLRQRREKGRC